MLFPLPGWELLSVRAVESARETLISVAIVMSGIFGAVVYKVAQAQAHESEVWPRTTIGSNWYCSF